MNPDNRQAIARFLIAAKPVTEEWSEERLAFKWHDSIYLIKDNWPEWTVSQILDFCNSIPKIEIFNLEVKVRAKESEGS